MAEIYEFIDAQNAELVTEDSIHAPWLLVENRTIIAGFLSEADALAVVKLVPTTEKSTHEDLLKGVSKGVTVRGWIHA